MTDTRTEGVEALGGTADVIVVGAGVIGCATAYNLALRGAQLSRVLERATRASATAARVATAAASGSRGATRASCRSRCMYAVEHLWPGLSEELGADVEYVKKGNLRLGKTEHHLEVLRGLAKTGREHGLDMRMLSTDEVRELNPSSPTRSSGVVVPDRRAREPPAHDARLLPPRPRARRAVRDGRRRARRAHGPRPRPPGRDVRGRVRGRRVRPRRRPRDASPRRKRRDRRPMRGLSSRRS